MYSFRLTRATTRVHVNASSLGGAIRLKKLTDLDSFVINPKLTTSDINVRFITVAKGKREFARVHFAGPW